MTEINKMLKILINGVETEVTMLSDPYPVYSKTDFGYVVATDPDTGAVACSCGATAQRADAKRFLRRHPQLCSERRRFARQLAQGTRCVDSEDRLAEYDPPEANW